MAKHKVVEEARKVAEDEVGKRAGAGKGGAEAKEAGDAELVRLLEEHMHGPVRLLVFTSAKAPTSGEQLRLLEALSRFSEKIIVEPHDLDTETELAASYGVERAPCTAVIGGRDYGLRFYGLTAGHELSSFLEALLMVSNGKSGLSPQLSDWVGRISTPTVIEILVTLTCPYCPRVVHAAQQMAVESALVRVDVIELAEFPELALKLGHTAVPTVSVNGRFAFEGMLSAHEVILEVVKSAAPEEFEKLEAELREKSGASLVTEPEPGHVYDLAIVGAGPAGMAAAVYAVRKGLDVVLLGDRLGGQVTETATIENWLGAPRVGGRDLALMFRAHMEHYALAEKMNVRVDAVRREGDRFVAHTDAGWNFEARTLIWAAGKRYRTLEVPGETRFLGRGIAFCATCDAPLLAGRRVLVVGGGNSAFTAARDLLPYATEIHLANILPDWQADAVLRKEVFAHRKVVPHPATRVVAFLGEEELTGVRLAPAEVGDAADLPVDGVFLEIGLLPNSAPVAGLAPLNDAGEVMVARDQSTALPGFFAAGDVTDEPEKQIVVAEGSGAKAGLAAHRYLAAHGWSAKGSVTGGQA